MPSLDERDVRKTAQAWTREAQREGRYELLGMACDTFRWLVRATDSAASRSDLFVALQLAYGVTGDLAVLDEAVELGPAVVDAAAEGPRRARQESNLANALRLRFEATGERRDLNESVQRARRGLDPTAPAEIQAQRHSNLALPLRLRYELLERRADLDESLSEFQHALKLAGDAEPQHSRIMSNLSVSTRLIGMADADADKLAEAVEQATRILDDDIDEADRPGFLINAALACLDLHRLTGAPDALDRGLGYLDQTMTLPSATDSDVVLATLNASYGRRLKASSSRDSIDEAVAAALKALKALRPDSPDLALAWAGLGRACWLRFQDLREPADARHAIQARLESAQAPGGAPALRTQSGVFVGRWSMEVGEPLAAMAGYAQAIALLPEVAWRGMERSERERGLTEFDGLAGDAMAAALAAGSESDALVFVEHGRSVLWYSGLKDHQTAELARTHPDLTAVLTALRDRIDALDTRRVQQLLSEATE